MPTDEQYKATAHYLYCISRKNSTDDIEIDPDAKVSQGDDPGAWVQAWVWVDDSEVESDDDDR